MADAVHGALAQGWLRRRVLARTGYSAGMPQSAPANVGASATSAAGDRHGTAVDAVLREVDEGRSPQEAWLDIQGWLQHKVLAKARHSVGKPREPAGTVGMAAGRQSVDGQTAAIDAVLSELAETRPLQGAWLDVDLADSLVQLDVVKGDFAGDSDRRLQTVAAACMAELLGEAAQRHEVRWQLQPGGSHLLIAAIAQAQLRALTDAAARHGLRLRSVRPDFGRQWNLHSSALKPGTGVFAVACGREAVIACVSRGAIVEISSGGWLDKPAAANDEMSPGTRLMSGFGLDPLATAKLLDKRCDRLLASVGQDPALQSAYVLVAPPLSSEAVSSRWTVVNREARVQ